jgi:hypothetical protein
MVDIQFEICIRSIGVIQGYGALSWLKPSYYTDPIQWRDCEIIQKPYLCIRPLQNQTVDVGVEIDARFHNPM